MAIWEKYRFNSRRYQARVVDLLDWKLPELCRKKCSRAAKRQQSLKQVRGTRSPCSGRVAHPQGQQDSTSVADSAREMESREVKETTRRALSGITNTCFTIAT